MIHVFETFDGERAEKWETIEWDRRKNFEVISEGVRWQLACDFRMPHEGRLVVPDPRGEDNLEFEYELPTLQIPNYEVGQINQASFTDELRAEWDELPARVCLEFGGAVLECKKDIIDPLEHSIMGYYYIYRPDAIVAFANAPRSA